MSTKLEYRERQRQKKEKVGDRPAKLNVKKSDRELQQKIKNSKDRKRQQRQKKEKVGDRPAKLNVKKSDRELQQKIKNSRDFLVGRTT